MAIWPLGALRAGFVASDQHILTVWHNIRDIGGAEAQPCILLTAPEPAAAHFECGIQYIAHNEALDACLMGVIFPDAADEAQRLRTALASVALPLGPIPPPLSAIRVGGFPELNPAINATVYAGTIDTPDAVIGELRAIRAHVPAFAAQDPDAPKGMSGGPILYRGHDRFETAVGLLSSFPAPKDNRHHGGGSLGGGVICRRIDDIGKSIPEVGDLVLAARLQADALNPRSHGTSPLRAYFDLSGVGTRRYRDIAIDVCQRLGIAPLIPISHADLTDLQREREYGVRAEDSDVFVAIYAGAMDEQVVSLRMERLRWLRGGSERRAIHILVDDAYSPSNTGLLLGNGYPQDLILHVSGEADFRGTVFTALEENVSTGVSVKKRIKKTPKQHRDLPSPPELMAQPAYSSSAPFTGRAEELRSISDWLIGKQPVIVIEAIGGTGKSALTWEWATVHVRRERPDISGIFWWSFYDGSPSMERFLRMLLGYLRAESSDAANRLDRHVLVDSVERELQRRPYLVILDGFERLLMAYHSYDPSRVSDDDVDADRRGNKHAMIDKLGYDFVRRMTKVERSKFVITSRMIPDALEDAAAGLLPGVERIRLPGLSDADTHAFLRRLNILVEPQLAMKFFAPLGNHPLLISIVGGLVRNFRRAPRDFAAWLASEPVNIGQMNIAARRNHILAAALDGLDSGPNLLLGWLALLPASVHWNIVESVNPFDSLPATGGPRDGVKLDFALRELEVRGLLWWNRSSNTYDMHPIVRAVAADRLSGSEARGANDKIAGYFQALPQRLGRKASSVEDLEQTITLFRALVGAGKNSAANHVWSSQLARPLLVELGANETVAELLQPYRRSDYIAMRADHSICLHQSGDHASGREIERDILMHAINLKVVPEVLASLGRLETHLRCAGNLAACADVIEILQSFLSKTPLRRRGGTILRAAVLQVLTGNWVAAERLLGSLEAGLDPGNNPWFASDVVYWKLVLEFRSTGNLNPSKVQWSADRFATWKNHLRLAVLRFESMVRAEQWDEAVSVADEVNRFRRVGGLLVLPAESALAYAPLNPERAIAIAAECEAALSRVHSASRPYLILGFAFAWIGDAARAERMGRHARSQALADGGVYRFEWELHQATTLLQHIGIKSDTSEAPWSGREPFGDWTYMKRAAVELLARAPVQEY